MWYLCAILCFRAIGADAFGISAALKTPLSTPFTFLNTISLTKPQRGAEQLLSALTQKPYTENYRGLKDISKVYASSIKNLRLEDPPIPPNIPGKPNTPPQPVILPKVEDGRVDILSKLLKDRILILGNQVTDEVANTLVAQMMFLASEDSKKDIKFYINSPGGSVTAGMAIFDTMQYIPCDVETICFGSACSMGAFLLSAGTFGKRKSLPNSRIMIHQPLGGAHGQAADIEIQTKEILFTRQAINTFLAYNTGQPISKIEKDTDRNFFMTPYEAKEYGLIDEVLKTKMSHVEIGPMPTFV